MTSFIETLSAQIANSSQKNHEQFSNLTDWVVLSNGLTGFEETLIFFGFQGKKNNPVLVAKIPRITEHGWDVESEFKRLTAFWNCLGANASFRIPEPIALLNIDRQIAMVTTYADGEGMMYSNIMNNKEKYLEFSIEAAKLSREIIDQTVTLLSPGETIPSDFKNKTNKFIQMYSLSKNEIKAVEDLAVEIEVLRKSATHKVLNHGDFWLGNIIRSTKHKRLMLIDFQDSRWSHDVSLDVYLFLLSGAVNTIPLVSPQARARKAADVLSSWQDDIIPSYLFAFGAPKNYSLLSVRSGMLFCCIEKAVRASIELGYRREMDLVWRYMFYEILEGKIN